MPATRSPGGTGAVAPHQRLYINVDHVATIRQARKTDEPDPVAAAAMCEAAGADGITAHLREDRRHMQDADIERLVREARTVFNLENGRDQRDGRDRRAAPPVSGHARAGAARGGDDGGRTQCGGHREPPRARRTASRGSGHSRQRLHRSRCGGRRGVSPAWRAGDRVAYRALRARRGRRIDRPRAGHQSGGPVAGRGGSARTSPRSRGPRRSRPDDPQRRSRGVDPRNRGAQYRPLDRQPGGLRGPGGRGSGECGWRWMPPVRHIISRPNTDARSAVARGAPLRRPVARDRRPAGHEWQCRTIP